MKFKINFKPYPGADYFTVREHKRRIDSIKYNHPNAYLGNIEQNIRLLFNIPTVFKFEILQLKVKEQLYEKAGSGSLQIIVKDDPVSGIDTKQSSGTHSALDLSYSFPQKLQDYSHYNYLIIDPNASLGIPIDLVLLFYRNDSSEIVNKFVVKYASEYLPQIYLLYQVISDYVEKGMDLIVRESNYKAVVLNQLIENSRYLKPILNKNNRSKTMISADCDPWLLDKIEKMGFEVEVNSIDAKAIITIANYPTHSKELVEMFSDRILGL